jgi:hypothetical protein
MLLTSSILTYYSTTTPVTHSLQGRVILALRARVARWLSIFLRRLAKLMAGLNAVWLIAIGLLQFSSFFDRCYCRSSVMGLGKHAYIIISLVSVDLNGMRTAWVSALFLAAGAAMLFAGFVTLFINPPLPP